MVQTSLLPEKTFELLATKLAIPPPRSPIVSRKSLLARLDEGMEQKLTLVSAPAGFGKTTLVVDWVENVRVFSPSNIQTLLAWFSLDSGDNDPLRFWRYVLTAVQAFDLDELLHASQQPDIEAVLTMLINELAQQSGKIILVLEDYHSITNSQIHEGIAFLLDHLPPALHLVLLTRNDPPLPLARLRARNEINELRAIDLRFSEAEARDFLQQTITHHHLSPEATARLSARTEGWPAGLRLVALALQGKQELGEQEQFLNTFTGSHRPILEYLTEDVLASQKESIQEFLLETSLLNRLTGSLCDAVTGRNDGAHLLDQLERANLFLEPLDGSGQWYRFHALFSEAMRYAARQRLGEERQRQLAYNASLWYEEHAMPSEAIEAALFARAFERVACLIEQILEPRLGGKEYHTLLRWMQNLPEDLLCNHPTLCMTLAQAVLFTSEVGAPVPFDRVHALLDIAEQSWVAEGNECALGGVLAFRSLIAGRQGEFIRSFDLARQALARLPESETEWRGISLIFTGWGEYHAGQLNAALHSLTASRALFQAVGNFYGLLDSTLGLGEIHTRRAEPQQAAELYRQALVELERAPIERKDALKRQGRALLGLAALAYERNDLEASGQVAAQVVSISEELNSEDLLVQGEWVLSRVQRARNEIELSRNRLNSLIARIKRPALLRQVQAMQAWLALAAGDLAAVQRWSAARHQLGNDLPILYQEQEALILARVQIAQGEAGAALNQLESWLDGAQAQGRARSELEIRILIALAEAALDHLPQARQSLVQALALAQPVSSFLRVFLDETEPLRLLILACRMDHVSLGQDRLLNDIDRLLEAFADEHITNDLQSIIDQKSKISYPIEPLSQQEERVLRLLAAGLSNIEIAQELVVSVNTVKTHIKSIYRKLNVNNRRAVREVVRRLKLL